MTVLSVISIIIYTAFFIGAGWIVTVERKTVLNISACAVLSSLAWWSFCYSFFFAAPTAEEAFFWHKLASFGWCGFVAITAFYFLALTDKDKFYRCWWKLCLFFLPMVVLICRNFFGETTSLAQKIIPAANGWGWTYQNSVTSFWLWVYVIYLISYFGAAFYMLYKWAKAVKHKLKRELAIGFIILDMITILFGVTADIVLPLTYPILPALASVGTALFGVGYFGIVCHYDVFNINLVISSDDIFKASNNPLIVIDELGEVLKCNRAAQNLLTHQDRELIGANISSFILQRDDFNKILSTDNLLNSESQVVCKDGEIKDVLLSSSVITDKNCNFVCIILSCQDVTKQKQVQKALEAEQKKYKELAEDYHYMANYDILTALPNRRFFFDVLGKFEKNYYENNADFAALFIDLDDFKHLNDFYGHHAGDELLSQTAKKLKTCIVEGEFAARLGGDEFMILMPCSCVFDVEEKIASINSEFQAAVQIHKTPYKIEFSIGYALFSKTGNTIRLMQCADENMYDNKQTKKLRKNNG
ncbi:MAG: diguanylate cyclase [Clostridia bacterium]|nr:diguanylate cyclase [Clostridia bacterium]